MISYSRAVLMREQSSPKVFFVYGGFKFWIQTPDALFALGFDWSKVQVVPDGTLAALPEKTFDTMSPVKASDVFFKPVDVFIPLIDPDPYEPMMSKDPAFIVRKNIIVAGWLADPESPGALGALNCWGAPTNSYVTEDYHYDVILDIDFMYQLYGPGGLSTALNGAILPGNLAGLTPPYTLPTMSFDDASLDGLFHGVTSNSFALPHMAGGINHSGSPALGFEDPLPNNNRATGPLFIHGELNCWHVNGGPPVGTRPWNGRGTAPSGWVQWAACNESNNDAWWPYHPLNPDGGPQPFQTGDYVLMKGAVVQEHAHDSDIPSLWRAEQSTKTHCGVIEMHPPDWIVRVQEPPIRKTACMVTCCTARTVGDSPTNVQLDTSIFPFPYLQPPPGANAVIKWRKVIDGRFTRLGTFQDHATLQPATLDVSATVQSTNVQGRYKASYEIWWEMPLMATCFPNRVTIGRNVTIRVHAEDSSTHAAVAGTVKANGVVIGSSDVDIQHVFKPSEQLTFSAPNYSDIPLQLSFLPGSLQVTTTPIIFNRIAPVTVSATNSAGEAVTNGDVLINGVKVGVLGQPFNYKFVSSSPPGGGPLPAKPLGGSHPVKEALAVGPKTGSSTSLPAGTVNAPGYVTAAIHWNVSDSL